MDYTATKEELAVQETIFDGCLEQPVDFDFSLPDYCPDIQRILKCQVYPCIQSRSLTADRVEVEGVATVKLLYLDAGKLSVRCCEHSEPFSCSFQMKQPAQNAVVFTQSKVEYINCRAVSPRKLDIHGAFSICAKVIGRVQQEVVCDIPGDGIQQKKKTVQASRVASIAQQQFSVNEVLEIGQGKPEAEGIIRTDAVAVVHDCKAVANKMILKGEAMVKVLYAGNLDAGDLETMEYAVPVSQIVDADGLSDDCLCDARLEVLGCEVQIRTDSAGEDSLLAVDLKMAATIVAFEEAEVQVVTDAYSTQYELQLDYKNMGFERLLEFTKDTCIYKNTLDLSGGVSRVIDVWNEMSSITAQPENGQLAFRGKFNVCVLAVSNEGEPVYTEKMIDFEYLHDWSGKPAAVRCDAKMDVVSLGYRISGSSGVEIRAELGLTGGVFLPENYRTVCHASADESKPRQRDQSASLIIYYADAGESIWDIARAYCTSMEAIQAENDLVDEVLEGRSMLLIPVS